MTAVTPNIVTITALTPKIVTITTVTAPIATVTEPPCVRIQDNAAGDGGGPASCRP